MSEQLFYVLEAEAGFDLDIGAFADSLEGANAAADIAFSNEGATIIDAFFAGWETPLQLAYETETVKTYSGIAKMVPFNNEDETFLFSVGIYASQVENNV